MENEFKKIVCIDFDGVIHSYKSGWKGVDIIPDPPVDGAFDVLQKYCQHFRVAIYSSRSKSLDGLDAMKKWFILHDWPHTGDGEPLCIEFPVQKPPAWITIDDRCIRFMGIFPTIAEIETFKTWQQKENVFEYIRDKHNASVREINFLKKIVQDDKLDLKLR